MPIRQIVRRQANAQVWPGRVEAADRDTQSIRVSQLDERISCDYLVVSTGARHTYFGHDDWQPFTPVLKTAEDAIAIRRRGLAAFESAEVTTDANEHRRLLSFVVIGGGPTGVEIAGAIAELARAELAMPHRELHDQRVSVALVEAGPRRLSVFPAPLVGKVRHSLEDLGVQVLNDTPVELCDADDIVAAGKSIGARTLIWAAGIAASFAATWLGAEADKSGRVRVEVDLSLPGA